MHILGCAGIIWNVYGVIVKIELLLAVYYHLHLIVEVIGVGIIKLKVLFPEPVSFFQSDGVRFLAPF